MEVQPLGAEGVPVRLELGPRDLKQNQIVTVRRDTNAKSTLPLDGLKDSLKALLETIQDDLYAKALKERDEHLVISEDWDDFCDQLDNKKIIQAPFCGVPSCEEQIKKDSARDAVVEEGAPAMGAKSLCIPFKQPKKLTNQKCILRCCTVKPKAFTLFGRSY